MVEGRWLDRLPRRPDVARRLAVEARLMPRLAPRLALAVPVPEPLGTDPERFRHPLVPGRPVHVDRLTADDGRRLGEFLRALHDSPPSVWEGTGIGDDGERLGVLAEMEQRVVPLLPVDLQRAGRALLARARDASHLRVLRHGDLGPAHLLATDDGLCGVIDWTDVALGDPALDLAWTVHRTRAQFADALATAYGATGEELARGADWSLLGPWWEVHHGLTGGGEEYVGSGLGGVGARLRAGR